MKTKWTRLVKMQPNSSVGGYDLRIGKGQQLRMQGSGKERAEWYDRSGDNWKGQLNRMIPHQLPRE
jgi:hypothetical protein